jgi:hypothetical protein
VNQHASLPPMPVRRKLPVALRIRHQIGDTAHAPSRRASLCRCSRKSASIRRLWRASSHLSFRPCGRRIDCRIPTRHLQATGRDARGRRQSCNRVPPNYFPLLPMDGYFFFTAALTLAFSAGVPDCATRERAFLPCASFSIGYLRLSGSAKDFAGSAFRAAVVSFAIVTSGMSHNAS